METIILLFASFIFLVPGFMGTKRHKIRLKEETKLGWFKIATGLAMSFVGGAATITMSGIGYANGWIGLVDPLAVILGGIILILFINKSKLPKTNEGIANYFAGNDKYLRIIYSIATLFVYGLLASAQVVALAKLAKPYMPGHLTYVFSIVTFLFIVTYVHLGGIVSVTKTDIAQFIVVILLFVFPIIIATSIGFKGVSLPVIPTVPLDFKTILYLSLSFLFVPLSQDAWLRVKKAKDDKNAKLGLFLGVLIYGGIVTLAIFAGYYASSNGLNISDAETVLPSILQNQLGFAGIIPTLFILAAVMSTLDSFCYNISNSLHEDLLPIIGIPKSVRSKLFVSLFIIVSATFIAFYAKSVLSLVLSALMIYVSVIGPSLILRKFKIKRIALVIPAMITLISILSFGIIGISIPGEPYSYIVIHLALIFTLNIFLKKE